MRSICAASLTKTGDTTVQTSASCRSARGSCRRKHNSHPYQGYFSVKDRMTMVPLSTEEQQEKDQERRDPEAQQRGNDLRHTVSTSTSVTQPQPSGSESMEEQKKPSRGGQKREEESSADETSSKDEEEERERNSSSTLLGKSSSSGDTDTDAEENRDRNVKSRDRSGTAESASLSVSSSSPAPPPAAAQPPVTSGFVRKRCEVLGCMKYPRKGGKCAAHGGITRIIRCSVEGCQKYAVRRRLCKAHGANRDPPPPSSSSHSLTGATSVPSSSRAQPAFSPSLPPSSSGYYGDVGGGDVGGDEGRFVYGRGSQKEEKRDRYGSFPITGGLKEEPKSSSWALAAPSRSTYWEQKQQQQHLASNLGPSSASGYRSPRHGSVSAWWQGEGSPLISTSSSRYSLPDMTEARGAVMGRDQREPRHSAVSHAFAFSSSYPSRQAGGPMYAQEWPRKGEGRGITGSSLVSPYYLAEEKGEERYKRENMALAGEGPRVYAYSRRSLSPNSPADHPWAHHGRTAMPVRPAAYRDPEHDEHSLSDPQALSSARDSGESHASRVSCRREGCHRLAKVQGFCLQHSSNRHLLTRERQGPDATSHSPVAPGEWTASGEDYYRQHRFSS